MDPIDEIKQLYFKATAQSIESDFARAIDAAQDIAGRRGARTRRGLHGGTRRDAD